MALIHIRDYYGHKVMIANSCFHMSALYEYDDCKKPYIFYIGAGQGGQVLGRDVAVGRAGDHVDVGLGGRGGRGGLQLHVVGVGGTA